jgi:class 3 adenylate cyclase
MQEIRHCVAQDGAEIAFAVSGSGPPLVLPAWWVSDVEADWEDAGWRNLFDLLGTNHTVVRYDRPGTGRSARPRTSFTLEDEIVYLQAVIEDLAITPVSLVAMSCGGPPAVALAARRPDLVARLVLYASYIDGTDIAPTDTRDALVALVRSAWGSVGSRALADIFLPSATRDQIAEFARSQQEVATPDVAAELLQLTYDMEVRSEVDHVQCPVLVLHRSGDRAIHPRCGQALARALATASMVELPGTAHSMHEGDSVALVREIERFLLGSSSLEFSSRELAAVLFTDIVDSTPLAARLGDEEWAMRLDEHDRISRAAVEHFGGRTVKDTGDGALAVFGLPTQALSCARKLHRDLQQLGFQVRAGIHVGEIELRGDDIAGIEVNTAARVMGQATGGDTLVTSVVRDLSAGSGFAFDDLPLTRLKGIDGEWVLSRAT